MSGLGSLSFKVNASKPLPANGNATISFTATDSNGASKSGSCTMSSGSDSCNGSTNLGQQAKTPVTVSITNVTGAPDGYMYQYGIESFP